MFNNVASAAMDSFWDSRSLRRSEMMTVDASEVPMLAMILSEERTPPRNINLTPRRKNAGCAGKW